jgi:hypothetical protein
MLGNLDVFACGINITLGQEIILRNILIPRSEMVAQSGAGADTSKPKKKQ